MAIYHTGMIHLPSVIDRFNGMSYQKIADKYKFAHASQARAYYVSTLAYLVMNSKVLQKRIRKELECGME